MLLGIVIMLIGAGSTAFPTFSEISFGGATLKDIPAFSASLIFVGIVVLVVGVGAYFKGK